MTPQSVAEDQVVQEVIARGLCTPEQIAAARASAAQGGPGLLPLLRERFLDADSARELGQLYVQALGAAQREAQATASRQVGAYSLLDELGRGGMGAVFRAQDAEGQVVALKLLTQHEPSRLRRFLRERELMRFVGRHPNVVKLRDAGEAGGAAYLAMDLVEGGTLADWLELDEVDPTRAAETLAKVAEGVHFAHEAGVIHRDLKPANVLIDERGEPQVTDFGVAKDLQAEERLTYTGQLVGTVGYMAPEQARGRGEVDRRTDVYALGVLLYELLCGQRPFLGPPLSVLAQIGSTEPPPPRSLRESVPAGLEAICLKALAKDPQERYQTAAAFAADLRRWARPDSESALGPGADPARAGGGGWRAAGLALGGLALGALGALSFGAPSAGGASPRPSARSSADAASPLARARAEAERWEERGAWVSAAEQRWAALRLAGEPGDLCQLARSLLEEGEVGSALGLWKELAWRCSPEQRPLDQIPRSETLSLVRTLEDEAAAPALRAAAAVALGRVEGTLALQALRGALDGQPLVAEAARGTLVLQGVAPLPLEHVAARAPLAEWLEHTATKPGPLAALTLLELAAEGQLVGLEWFQRLRSSPEPLLRAALPLAGLVAVTRWGGALPKELAPLLEALCGDEDGFVAAQAQRAQQALRAFRGDEGATVDAAGLRLMTGVVELERALRASQQRSTLSAKARSVEERALASSDPALAAQAHLLRAARHLRAGSCARARELLEAVVERTPAGSRLAVAELLAQEAALQGEVRELPAELEARDPAAFAASAARVELARRYGVLATPGRNGATRVVIVLAAGKGARALAHEGALAPEEQAEGLLVRQPTLLSTRFGVRSLESVRLLGQHLGERGNVGFRVWTSFSYPTRSGLMLSLASSRVSSSGLDDEPEIAQRQADQIRTGVSASLGRCRVEGYVDGARCIDTPLRTAKLPHAGPLIVTAGWLPQGHLLRRLEIEGRLSPLPPRQARRLARADAWRPLPDDLPILRERTGVGPVTLGALRREGWNTRLSGSWVARTRAARMLVTPSRRGDVELQAKVTPSLAPGRECGLVLRRGLQGAYVALAIRHFEGRRELCLKREGHGGWYFPLARLPASEELCLRLRRVGSYVEAAWGKRWDELQDLDPFYFPFVGPVEACLYASADQPGSHPGVRFSEVEARAPGAD